MFQRYKKQHRKFGSCIKMTFGVVLSEASERKDKAEKEAIIYVVEFWRASAACCICPQTSVNI